MFNNFNDADVVAAADDDDLDNDNNGGKYHVTIIFNII